MSNDTTPTPRTDAARRNLERKSLPALSIRQPWAWAILHAGKDVENRSWHTNFRGRFLIHAAKGMTRAEYEDAGDVVRVITRGAGNQLALPPMADLERGGIVGVAEIVDCVSDSPSQWFFGRYGFVLRNVQPLPFYPCKGALGFFKIAERKDGE